MCQPKRRAALLLTGGLSVALAALGLAPRPAHAQWAGGMAMPRGLIPPPGTPQPGMPPAGAMAMPRGLMPSPGMPSRPPLGGPFAAPGLPVFGQSYGPAFGPVNGQAFPRGFPDRGGPPGRPFSNVGIGSYGGDSARRFATPMRPPADALATLRPFPTVPTRSRPVRPRDHNISIGSAGLPTLSSSGTTTNGYIYAPQTPVTVVGGPSLLGGYYYGGYCDSYSGADTYPTVYSTYIGFPPYIYSLGVTYQSLESQPVYLTAPLPFNPPQYQVTYNEVNYYVTSEDRAAKIEDGGAPAKKAVHLAFPANSYQAAFADIERAWTDGNLSLLKNHLRSNDTKVSVFLHSKYKYSLNSSDFSQITRDAFDRLDTLSFKFTRLRKAKNGDVTAYGKHVYQVSVGPPAAQDAGATADNTVPFDDTPSSADAGTDTPGVPPDADTEKTVYVSYTLRHGPDGWYITAVDSSPDPLVKEAQ